MLDAYHCKISRRSQLLYSRVRLEETAKLLASAAMTHLANRRDITVADWGNRVMLHLALSFWPDAALPRERGSGICFTWRQTNELRQPTSVLQALEACFSTLSLRSGPVDGG